MIIAITGTPGTGKTTLAKILSKEMNLEIFDVNDFIEKNKKTVLIEYDEDRETNVIDDNKLMSLIEEKLRRKEITDAIIDSHLSHYISQKYIDACIVLSCDLSVLKKRLKKRGYNTLKITENLEAESFDEIKEEAKELHENVIYVDTTKKITIKNLIQGIKKIKK